MAVSPVGGQTSTSTRTPEDDPPLGRRVPQPHAPVLSELHDGERRGIDQRLQPLVLSAIGHVVS
jgi:hypothetical protein